MQNIGAEVSRAIRYKEAGQTDRATARAKEAITMLNVMKSDPKNKKIEKEIDFMIEEFDDYMNGCIKYDSDPDLIIQQYDIFLY